MRSGSTLPSQTSKRKLSHIKTALRDQVQSHVPTGFDDVRLIHRALPEIDRDDVDLTTKLFGHEMKAPLIIESMTGGTPMAAKINRGLAAVAEKLRLGMGVGSQRAAVEDENLAYTYRVARDAAPSIPLFANLGCTQIARSDAVDYAKKAVDMIDATGLFIHLNALQETVQFEGQTNFSRMLERIRTLASTLSVPVLVKETGAGIARETAQALALTGVKGVDVSGVGGTSWAAVEYYRAKAKGYELQMKLGETFWDWGIPTVPSIVEVSNSTDLIVVASGGVRNGLHIAKALALGADFGGLALPMLKSVSSGEDAALEGMKAVIEELKNATFLTGARNIEELRKAPLVITGATYRWLLQRGFEVSKYANR